jgi:hypothetical protein
VSLATNNEEKIIFKAKYEGRKARSPLGMWSEII